MQTRWLFILVGRNDTGKTTLQKYIIKRLCGVDCQRLRLNTTFDITDPNAPRRLSKLFAANRSFQEKRQAYKTVKKYFLNYFNEVEAAIISTHSYAAKREIGEMIHEGKKRIYNVAGVFFSNAIDKEVKQIVSELNWDERIYLENPAAENSADIEKKSPERSGISSRLDY